MAAARICSSSSKACSDEAAGPELAGKMHTARSRNDIAVTLYRMAARREILGTARALAELRTVLLEFAAAHIMTIMPAHTHTQPAQPTTLAHYLLAAIEFLARDSARLQAAFARVNLSPMGAAAITTSGFPIDRDRNRAASRIRRDRRKFLRRHRRDRLHYRDRRGCGGGHGQHRQTGPGFAPVVDARVRISALEPTRSCNLPASCRRSVIRWRWSTSASWPAARWAKPRRCLPAPTTLLSAT